MLIGTQHKIVITIDSLSPDSMVQKSGSKGELLIECLLSVRYSSTHFMYTSNNSDQNLAVDNLTDEGTINVIMRKMRKIHVK